MISPLRVTGETGTGTLVELPLEKYEANIVVFTPGKIHVNPPSVNSLIVKEITLPGEWGVSFVPTMDNSWGDFRMPVTEDNKIIGLEARRFAWSRETENISGTAMLPATDDSNWEKKLHGFGTQFYVLGPIPKEIDIVKLDAELAQLGGVDPAVPVTIDGRTIMWHPYDFSWRWGKEGDSGHQGYHGLKRTVTDDFLCLGKPVRALNETRYVDEPGGSHYYIWSCATVDQPVTAEMLVSRKPPADKSHTSAILVPAAVYVNGVPVMDSEKGISLKNGPNPFLVRYDHAGRGHIVLRRKGITAPASRQPLAMRWYNDEGVIPFDIYAGKQSAEWFRFTTAPGTSRIRIKAAGKVEAWIDGNPMKEEGAGRFAASVVPAKSTMVALRVMPGKAGLSGGGLIPEPVAVETNGSGIMPLGDWSKIGILNNYSGGVLYQTSLKMTGAEARARMIIDLGQVAGTAEILVNGRKVGVHVAPPWKQEITGLCKAGENTLEVLVYNTLSNHYQTIPSTYRGDPLAGLLGPERLLSQSENKGEK